MEENLIKIRNDSKRTRRQARIRDWRRNRIRNRRIRIVKKSTPIYEFVSRPKFFYFWKQNRYLLRTLRTDLLQNYSIFPFWIVSRRNFLPKIFTQILLEKIFTQIFLEKWNLRIENWKFPTFSELFSELSNLKNLKFFKNSLKFFKKPIANRKK